MRQGRLRWGEFVNICEQVPSGLLPLSVSGSVWGGYLIILLTFVQERLRLPSGSLPGEGAGQAGKDLACKSGLTV